MLDDLLGGERRDVLGLADLVEEQLELGDVAQLEVLGRGRGEPVAQGVQAGAGERVGLAAPSAVLHRAGQQPEVGEPVGFGVELGVREVPEQADRLADARFRPYGVQWPCRAIMPSTTYDVVVSRSSGTRERNPIVS